ncbi:hypothetical protein FRC01_002733, partial [Tulasnella sp. 417]
MAPELWSIDMEVPFFELHRDWKIISRLTSQVTYFRVHGIHSYWHPQSPFLGIPHGRQLRLLDLSNVVLEWNSPRLSGLIVLRLDCLLRNQLSRSHLTKILQMSPGLEELTFSSIRLQTESEGDFVGSNIISLPSLKSFKLTSVDSSFNELLPLLRMPATATIDLDGADIRDLTVGDDPLIFRVIPPVLPSAPCIA